LIHALGIRNVGTTVAGFLADHYGSLESLMKATAEDIAAVYGVGPVIAAEVQAFFAEERNRQTIRRLIESGVRYPAGAPPTSGELDGEVFVFTGSLESMSRSDAEAEVKKRGAKSVKNVSTKTTCVVAGDKSGSKLAKANELGIRVIDEGEFLKLIGRGG
jgi:DNA ligase (NAD+)